MDMYNYLKSTLRYEIKIPVKKSDMMAPDFEQFLDRINNRPNFGKEAVTDEAKEFQEQLNAKKLISDTPLDSMMAANTATPGSRKST